jgi:hypothetical protein
MELKIEAAHVKKVENDGSGDAEYLVTISPDATLEFLNNIMDDKLVTSFMESAKTKKWLAEKIGVEGLLIAFKKEDVLSTVGWDYVKEFFLDHMQVNDILNHVGWESAKEHFADKIAVESQQNDINTNGNKSILETIDESEGDNK